MKHQTPLAHVLWEYRWALPEWLQKGLLKEPVEPGTFGTSLPYLPTIAGLT